MAWTRHRQRGDPFFISRKVGAPRPIRGPGPLFRKEKTFAPQAIFCGQAPWKQAKFEPQPPNPNLNPNPNPSPDPNQVLRLLSQYADLDLEDRRLFDLYAREPHTR